MVLEAETSIARYQQGTFQLKASRFDTLMATSTDLHMVLLCVFALEFMSVCMGCVCVCVFITSFLEGH